MLRSLILTAPVIAVLSLTTAIAQSLPNEASHGDAIRNALTNAESMGADLQERMKLFQKEFDLPDDLADRAIGSLQNGRVRDLLGVPKTEDMPLVTDQQRYDGGVFLFASFSIPDPSLKALLKDASDMGVPVYFNGFVENSVVDTEARVRAIYGDDSISHGFGIDPTLFERFDITSVPTLVSTTVAMDVCESTDCSGDPKPDHDRVAGNVPLRYALEILAGGDGLHAEPAARILGGQR